MNKKYYKKNKKETYNTKTLSSKILGVFSSSPQKEYNYKQLASLLSISDLSERRLIVKILEELKNLGTLKEVSRGKYKLKSKVGYITGQIDMNKSGNAFLISDDISEDIFIPFANLGTALDRDTVKVSLYAKRNKNRIEGEVVEVLKRATNKFVGIIDITANYAFLIPSNTKMIFDIFIPNSNINGAKDGDKAIVEIIEWHTKSKNPTGKVIEVLGSQGNNETEMHAILAEFGLPYRFSPEIEKAAKKIKEKFSQYDYETRKDFRGVTTFTIDPEDAKDFDDALSFKKLDNGNFEIGVHIADVSHYILPNTVLDQEAYERATSVYLVDRVVPMLPERLSNYLCSLRPNEEKLCFSVVFEMTPKAQVIKYYIDKTIIKSDKRFSYEEVQKIIETENGEYKNEIICLNKIALKLREKRFSKGSFNFEHDEVKFILGENAVPIGVYFKESKEANNLIEEFMLLANKTVAEYIGKEQKKKDFVYRVHAEPNIEKLESFSKFISRFGYTIDTSNNIALSQSMNDIIKNIEGKSEQNIIENLAVRAMSKAVYTTKNIGHYGLSFDYYTHFTSPIRRYPDVLVHRLLFDYIKNKKADILELENKCKHCSYREQQAVLAERSSIKYKQVEFMQNKVGEVFEGVISGVTEWGFFVEIKENACEGLVHMRTLNDDFYIYDPENYCIYGDYSNKKYQLGENINVKIVNVSLHKKQIDLEVVST